MVARIRVFLVGAATNPAELNQSTTLTYAALISESENEKGAVKAAPLTLDVARSTIAGTIPRVDDDRAGADYDLLGTIDGAKHLTGSLKSKDGKITGEFRGRLLGPGGKEIALIATLKFPDGTYEVDLLTGKLQ